MNNKFYNVLIKSISLILLMGSFPSILSQEIKMNITLSSYLGSSGSEDGCALSVNKDGSVVIAGNTNSQIFPVTPNSYDITFNGGGEDGYGGDVYVTMINSNAIGYSTFVGGSKR